MLGCPLPMHHAVRNPGASGPSKECERQTQPQGLCSPASHGSSEVQGNPDHGKDCGLCQARHKLHKACGNRRPVRVGFRLREAASLPSRAIE